MGSIVYATWPDEYAEEPPIYLHGKPVPILRTSRTPCSVCVGVGVRADDVAELGLCAVVVRAGGVCRVRHGVLLAHLGGGAGKLPTTGLPVEIAGTRLSVIVVVDDVVWVLCHVSLSG